MEVEGETMSFENVVIEKRGRVAVLTINRPDKLNALNIPTRNEILAAFDQLEKDDEVRVVVITGAGEKAFIAGADINEFAGMTAVRQRAVMKGRRAFDAVEDFPKPVIAMINGFALGGGCELAMACDIRIASAKAKLGQPEIKLGIIPGGGGTQRLTRLVGEGKAMELILTGDMISAEEAQAWTRKWTYLRSAFRAQTRKKASAPSSRSASRSSKGNNQQITAFGVFGS